MDAACVQLILGRCDGGMWGHGRFMEVTYSSKQITIHYYKMKVIQIIRD